MREDIGVCLSRKDLGLGFWWGDEKFDKTENLEGTKDAMESMSSLLSELRSQHAATCNPNDDCFKTDKEIIVLDDDDDDEPESINKNSEDKDQVMMFSDKNHLTDNMSEQEMDQLVQLIDFESSLSDVVFSVEEVDEFASTLLMSSESVDGTSAETANTNLFSGDNSEAATDDNKALSENLSVSDNDLSAVGSLGECSNSNEETDIDKLIDFESTFEGVLPDRDEEFDKFFGSLMMNSDSELAVGDRVIIDEDYLNFSDVFDGLTTITAL